jgi:predicted RNA binding protein YcfA (HicA-like mRNA interferase family)
VPKLPIVTAITVIRFFNYSGFKLKRQKGSHKFFRHPDGRTITIPDHTGENLGRGILKKILSDVDVSRDEFLDWLQKKHK